ncbi:MAG: sigma-70 family RNA polymerase sigma factor [Oscillospiraceae bacterium]|nr:sigma-70 family RNA polymerase sigma factor [Oscillospiraceae bacterium]
MVIPMFCDRTDEELCALAAGGSAQAEEELILRHTKLVKVCSRQFFIVGGESEDLIQEGMLGLMKAVREFAPEKDASFKTYAEVCIRNRLISAVRSATRDKHAPLNSSVPLQAPSFDGERSEEISAISARELNPEELLIGEERAKEIEIALDGKLSGFESKVLDLYFQGCSYSEIAQFLGRDEKSVDNAVQRIRRKATEYISGGNS